MEPALWSDEVSRNYLTRHLREQMQRQIAMPLRDNLWEFSGDTILDEINILIWDQLEPE